MKIYLFLLVCFVGCYTSKDTQDKAIATHAATEASETKMAKTTTSTYTVARVEKTDDEWRSILSEQEYYVIRDKGTERPFTGALLENKDTGVYTCRACGLKLFHSKSKFKSGTGWPSYFEPIKNENIKEDTDYHLGYARTEIMCARCDGHLGHVFPDGPQPTGLRYCVNSVSLQFEGMEEK